MSSLEYKAMNCPFPTGAQLWYQPYSREQHPASAAVQLRTLRFLLLQASDAVTEGRPTSGRRSGLISSLRAEVA